MADSLILTMPVPQMLGLKGTVKSLIGIYVVFCNLLFILDNSTKVQTKISPWGRFVQQHRIYRILKENKSIKFEERLYNNIIMYKSLCVLDDTQWSKNSICRL